nr:hypothetical protein [Tanacetum cinerariifolium]
MFRVDDLDGEEVVMETTTGVKDSDAPTKNVTEDEITMAQVLAALKSVKPKGRSFDEIKELFNREMRKVNNVVAMDSEAQKSSAKEAQESNTKRTAEHLESNVSKKQKINKLKE